VGDHRFDVKIVFTFHGKTYEFGPCWLNWGPSEVDFIDQRIVDFFRNAVDDAMGRYERKVAKHKAEDAEAAERREYERLREKFDPKEPPHAR